MMEEFISFQMFLHKGNIDKKIVHAGVTDWSDFEGWWSPSHSRCFCASAISTRELLSFQLQKRKAFFPPEKVFSFFLPFSFFLLFSFFLAVFSQVHAFIPESDSC